MLHEPLAKADDLFEYTVQLIDSSLEDSLDPEVVREGSETRWLGTVIKMVVTLLSN